MTMKMMHVYCMYVTLLLPIHCTTFIGISQWLQIA